MCILERIFRFWGAFGRERGRAFSPLAVCHFIALLLGTSSTTAFVVSVWNDILQQYAIFVAPLRRSGRHYVTASGAPDGCFLSGECSSLYVSIRSTFIALLRVFGLAAVCFGCFDRGFSSKKSQRASSRLE